MIQLLYRDGFASEHDAIPCPIFQDSLFIQVQVYGQRIHGRDEATFGLNYSETGQRAISNNCSLICVQMRQSQGEICARSFFCARVRVCALRMRYFFTSPIWRNVSGEKFGLFVRHVNVFISHSRDCQPLGK